MLTPPRPEGCARLSPPTPRQSARWTLSVILPRIRSCATSNPEPEPRHRAADSCERRFNPEINRVEFLAADAAELSENVRLTDA